MSASPRRGGCLSLQTSTESAPSDAKKAKPTAKDEGEGMARSARLGAWLGENLHVLNPVLYLYTKAMPKLITPLYNAFGVPGLVALPWVMLSLEKVAYDTFTAARGHDMYTEAQETGQNPHGEFPSGGGRSWFEMAHLWPRWRQRRPSRLPRGRRACLAYRGALLGSPSSLEWRRTVRLRAHSCRDSPRLPSNRRQTAVLFVDRGARRGGPAYHLDARR